MRKLATIREITRIDPIVNADAIELATVDGWKVVVKKGEFKIGDHCIYFEIDSWIPADIAPFLFKGRSYKGVEGERLRTVKLRGQISQGLLLPYWGFVDVVNAYHRTRIETGNAFDVTDILGVQLYESPLPTNLAGAIRGNFPNFVKKTDQERIQNLKKELRDWNANSDLWEVTEKMDGSSMTVYFRDNEFGVCSRNFDLKETEENAFWKMANELNLRESLTNLGENVAIQGELIGPGIQGNKYALSKPMFLVFDVYDIDKGSYLPSSERKFVVRELNLKEVPCAGMRSIFGMSIEDLLSMAEGKSVLNNKSDREGLVFKRADGSTSFKSISNKWLLRNEE